MRCLVHFRQRDGLLAFREAELAVLLELHGCESALRWMWSNPLDATPSRRTLTPPDPLRRRRPPQRRHRPRRRRALRPHQGPPPPPLLPHAPRGIFELFAFGPSDDAAVDGLLADAGALARFVTPPPSRRDAAATLGHSLRLRRNGRDLLRPQDVRRGAGRHAKGLFPTA